MYSLFKTLSTSFIGLAGLWFYACAQEDTSPFDDVLPPEFLPAVVCPSLLNCSGKPSDHIDVVYIQPPEFVTIPIFHQDIVTHTMTSTSYEAIVSVVPDGLKGICEKFVPVTKDEAETIIVFIDTTTTDHYYSVTTTTETLTTKYETAEVTPCVQEIGRLPPRKYQLWDKNFKKYLKFIFAIMEQNSVELSQEQEREVQESLSKYMYQMGADNLGETQIQQIAKDVILSGQNLKPEDIKLDINPEDLEVDSIDPEGKEL